MLRQLRELVESPIDAIHLSSLPTPVSDNFLEEIASHSKDEVQIFIENRSELLEKFNWDGIVFTNEVLKLEAYRAEFPHLKIGARTRSLADSKNWEGVGVDFIALDFTDSTSKLKTPGSILDSENFAHSFLRKDGYGWMLFSLNTPVLAAGCKTLDQLVELNDACELNGFLITDQFESHLSIDQKIHAIRACLD